VTSHGLGFAHKRQYNFLCAPYHHWPTCLFGFSYRKTYDSSSEWERGSERVLFDYDTKKQYNKGGIYLSISLYNHDGDAVVIQCLRKSDEKQR
jgi:hypothetical protein